MPRWFEVVCLAVCPIVAFACNDELVEEVPQDVCYSKLRWIGGKRGSPEMYPGQDCVGCHIDNDGPELMLGGTLYPYVMRGGVGETSSEKTLRLQSGEDCFGIGEGYTVTVTGSDGQIFEAQTNRAGNFYVEGKPSDLAKPFKVIIYWEDLDGAPKSNPMGTSPSYGGCANCHNPSLRAPEDTLNADDVDSADQLVAPVTRIGLPGYSSPNGRPGMTVEAELEAIADAP